MFTATCSLRLRMGGHGSSPLLVQCIPERVLLLLEDMCEDLQVGNVEFSSMLLRPCSRKPSSVLAVQWWRIRPLFPGSIRFRRGERVRCKMTDLKVGDRRLMTAGPAGLFSKSHICGCQSLAMGGDPRKSVWVVGRWESQKVVITDKEDPTHPTIFTVPALQTFEDVLATNRRYMLCYRYILNWGLSISVVDMYPPHEIADTFTIALRDTTVFVVAGSFLKETPHEHMIITFESVSMQFNLIKFSTHLDKYKVYAISSTTVVDPKERISDRMVTRWHCCLLQESSNQVIFCVNVVFDRGTGEENFFLLTRWECVEEDGSIALRHVWKSHPNLSLAHFSLHRAEMKPSRLDILSDRCSVLCYQSDHLNLFIDRKSLVGSKQGLRLLLKKFDPYEFGLTDMVHRFTPCPELAVVTQGIRSSKEKRRVAQIAREIRDS